MLSSARLMNRSSRPMRKVGSRKKSPTPNSSESATVPQASGPEKLTSSSSLRATSADQMSARMPRPSESHSITSPRKKGSLRARLS